jgi:hypothetical protein
LMQLLREIRERLREHDPEGIMIGEGFTDMTAQYCDGFWNWSQLRFPEIIRYSVPWMPYSHEIDANEYGDVNVCFANRILLDLKIEGGDGILSDFPEFSSHLKKLANLKNRLGRAYIDGLYRDEEGIEVSPEGAIVAKVYREQHGRGICVVAVNTADRKVDASVHFLHEIRAGIRVHSLRGDDTEVPGTGAIDLRLNPYEVRAFEYEI